MKPTHILQAMTNKMVSAFPSSLETLNSRLDKQGQSGFTLVEALIVICIIAVLFALSMASLGQPQVTGSVTSTVDTLLNDLKNQQILAMVGDIGTNTAQQPHGIYVQSTSYTLFARSSYLSTDTGNFVVSIASGITLSTSLPSTQVVFSKGTGDVSGFVNGSNTITVTSSGVSKVITIGRFGALTTN